MADHSLDMESSQSRRREIWIVGVTLGVAALLYRYAWIPVDWEVGLARAERIWGLPVTDVGKWFSGWAAGDGQAYAVIAADPFGLKEGWGLGYPTYRYLRAGFGWLAGIGSLGQDRWIPYGLALVSAASVIALFVLAVRLRPRLGRSAWLLPLNPTVLLAFAGDTAESLGILALAWTFASGRWWAPAALGIIRPTFLVALVGRWKLLLLGALSSVIFGGLWILRFGWNFREYSSSLSLPITGYWQEPSFGSIGLALLAAFTIFIGLRERDWGWVASGLFVLSFSGFVLMEPANGWRAAGLLFVLWAFGPGWSLRGAAVDDATHELQPGSTASPESPEIGRYSRA